MREVPFAGAAGADDQDGSALGRIAPGGEVMNEGAIELRQALEVELIERLGGAKRGAGAGLDRALRLGSCSFHLRR